MKPIDLLFSIGELNKIYNDSSNLQTVLDKTLNAIAGALDTQICSIYIYDEASQYLVLSATVGLAPEAVGTIKFHLNESLVGLALKESRTVYEENAAANPVFKLYRDASEELFRTFLAVPIIRGPMKLGVLVLRREKGKIYSDDEIKAAGNCLSSRDEDDTAGNAMNDLSSRKHAGESARKSRKTGEPGCVSTRTL